MQDDQRIRHRRTRSDVGRCGAQARGERADQRAELRRPERAHALAGPRRHHGDDLHDALDDPGHRRRELVGRLGLAVVEEASDEPVHLAPGARTGPGVSSRAARAAAPQRTVCCSSVVSAPSVCSIHSRPSVRPSRRNGTHRRADIPSAGLAGTATGPVGSGPTWSSSQARRSGVTWRNRIEAIRAWSASSPWLLCARSSPSTPSTVRLRLSRTASASSSSWSRSAIPTSVGDPGPKSVRSTGAAGAVAVLPVSL